MLHVKQFVFNAFGESTYIVYNPSSLDAIVIDPGMADKDEMDEFDRYIKEKNLNIQGIVNTHLHLDHCFGANYVKDKYGVMVSAHPADEFLGSSIDDQASRFGIRINGKGVMIDSPLNDGDTINIGDDSLEVIHTPGHTPGGICLYSPSGKFLISGDTIFKSSIGRTDLPGGDYSRLVSSINNKLMDLPDDTLILPGHGPATTIAEEKAYNPFIN